MINTTGSLRLHPYGATIPALLSPRWFLEVCNGYHALHPRIKTPISDSDIKRDLRVILENYQGHIEGHLMLEDTEDPDNLIRIYMAKQPGLTFKGEPTTVWGARSAYEGAEKYDTELMGADTEVDQEDQGEEVLGVLDCLPDSENV